jgi:exonuclease III
MTRIATWNLHHMARQIEIPEGVVAVIKHVRPDVLVLTEYVDRGKREDFENTLKENGYTAGAVSPAGPGQNQVLVASRVEQVDGTLNAPDVDEAARTNFVHRWLPTLELNVVGFRAPYYQGEDPAKLKPYWESLKGGALGIARGRSIYIGDFNWGKTKHDAQATEAISALQAAGYQLVPPDGGLDRALVSAAVPLRGWQVVEEAAGHRLTGEGGLSDHPMLVVEVE